MTNGLSASDHVRDVIGSCAHTRCGFCVCTACHAALQAIFRSVAIAKLLYASSAWIGFTKATDRQRVDGFLRRSIRSGYCSPDTPTFAEQSATVDEQLFNNICHNENHVYCTVSFLHPQQPHKTTIFDRELTANNYRNILDI